jgi:hypothetical protein
MPSLSVSEVEARLRRLGVPDHVVAKHVDCLKKLRRIRRKRLVRQQDEDGHYRLRAVANP